VKKFVGIMVNLSGSWRLFPVIGLRPPLDRALLWDITILAMERQLFLMEAYILAEMTCGSFFEMLSRIELFTIAVIVMVDFSLSLSDAIYHALYIGGWIR
jgi:hypothetical protein